MMCLFRKGDITGKCRSKHGFLAQTEIPSRCLHSLAEACRSSFDMHPWTVTLACSQCGLPQEGHHSCVCVCVCARVCVCVRACARARMRTGGSLAHNCSDWDLTWVLACLHNPLLSLVTCEVRQCAEPRPLDHSGVLICRQLAP